MQRKRKILGVLLGLGLGFQLLGRPEEEKTMQDPPGITSVLWGEVDGQKVYLYTLRNANGLLAKITNYGGILTELHVPDRAGKFGDVVLGFERLDQYLARHPYFGAMIGRVANRIARGRFTLDGLEYQLAANNGPNHLHGGIKGFDKKVWKATAEITPSGPRLILTSTSPDGEEGYPGTVRVTVSYVLTHSDELRIEMKATTEKATPVNIAHHSYWNLAGHHSGDILKHELMLKGDRYTPVDETLIPTGAIEPVKGTPFDFTQPKPIGKDVDQLPRAAGSPGGYDHNFVVNGEIGQLRLAARVHEPSSGRIMEIYTTQPGVQFYTGNFLDGSMVGKGGAVYKKHGGLCLETQHYPDSINKPNFPSCVLRPGQRYDHVMVHKFYVQ